MRLYGYIVATMILILLALIFPGKSRGEELPAPDVFVTFGCLQEQPARNLARAWEDKGKFWFDTLANQYLQTEECFGLYGPGYPAHIDRVVLKLEKKFDGEDVYVVEAHFYGASPGKKFYFLYYGELPARAHRSAA